MTPLSSSSSFPISISMSYSSSSPYLFIAPNAPFAWINGTSNMSPFTSSSSSPCSPMVPIFGTLKLPSSSVDGT
uniref:Uncharacterized protein n=2 Tax=Arabidopsis thaliana TaxID=3702 RepID=Q1G3J7_ARATH|nr:unknown protein [Arabidopsis thaliana]